VHTLPQVGAGHLAGLVRIAVDVDDVVGDRNAVPTMPPSRETLDLLVVGTENVAPNRPDAAIRQAVFS
jgi:hypothetical protein